MLGDWVYGLYPDGTKYKRPFLITAVDTYPVNKSPRIVTNGGYGFQEEQLAPIPLTPEILEKNGWQMNEDNEECYCYYNSAGDGYVKIILWDGGCGDWNVEIKNYSKFNNEIIYKNDFTFLKVHQLQHALKLCEIEKEIVL